MFPGTRINRPLVQAAELPIEEYLQILPPSPFAPRVNVEYLACDLAAMLIRVASAGDLHDLEQRFPEFGAGEEMLQRVQLPLEGLTLELLNSANNEPSAEIRHFGDTLEPIVSDIAAFLSGNHTIRDEWIDAAHRLISIALQHGPARGHEASELG